MLDNQYQCDVFFLLGNAGVRQGAHKFVLVSRSPVFDAMFYGPLSGGGEEDSPVIIPDIEPEPFMVFLRYMYCGEVSITSDNVIYLLYAAKKYAVLGLTNKCISYVDQVLDTDNACTVLEQAHIFDEKDFHSSVLALILRKAEEVLAADDITYLCEECLAKIIGSGDLMACEDIIFKACLRWADSECKRRNIEVGDSNRREVLGKILYKQPETPGMPPFWTEVFIYPFSVRPSAFFNTSLRVVQRQLRLNRFQGLAEAGFNNRSGSNAITFQTSRDIILEGFTIYGSCRASDREVDIKAQLLDPSEAVLCSVEKSIFTHGDTGQYDVILDQSAPLRNGVQYTLVVAIADALTFAGKDGRRILFSHNVAFTFSHSEKCQTATSVSHGQLPGLIFALKR
ncbi:BTB/POZ domain-containing protein [Plakobranchus ocellatus]|uniref:BTB/POZ domain-containing protein n=1 Tax=Plakobranchus ocellatus TaxID=259542 RepID=A0AAV4CUY3_9GAST|nr:BTB/POZ domain-containing protein [Plakobranchus ocellatus]